MNTKSLVGILRRWHIVDGLLYCPQCWGQYLMQFHDTAPIRQDARDGNTEWARRWPVCEKCQRDARES